MKQNVTQHRNFKIIALRKISQRSTNAFPVGTAWTWENYFLNTIPYDVFGIAFFEQMLLIIA